MGRSRNAGLTKSWHVSFHRQEDSCVLPCRDTPFIRSSSLHRPRVADALATSSSSASSSSASPSLQKPRGESTEKAEEEAMGKPSSSKRKCNHSPVEAPLKIFGDDLVEQARAGKLSPVIGRVAEINYVVSILSCRVKSSAILVGEPGVGKTAIVQGLAQSIAREYFPKLEGVRLIAVDMAKMLTGGIFEERLQAVLKEVEEAKGKVILCVDDIGSIIGAEDAASLITPQLSTGLLRCIVTATPVEYRNMVEKDAAFMRRFHKVDVAEPSVNNTVDILRCHRERFEFDYGVSIQDIALTTAADFATTYITEEHLPQKAISLVDMACSNVSTHLDGLPLEMQKLEEEKIKLKSELRSLTKDKTNKARRVEVRIQLEELRNKLQRHKQVYQEKKERTRRCREWRKEDILEILVKLDMKEHAFRIFKPTILKNEGPDEAFVALVEHAVWRTKGRQKFLPLLQIRLDKVLEEAEDDSKQLWEKRKQVLASEIQKFHRTEQKAPVTSSESMQHKKCYEDLMHDVTIGREHIAEVVSRRTGIPVTRLGGDDLQMLKELANRMHERVVGQKKAVNSVANAIKTSRLASGPRKKPIGSFLFLGPTGVGKTQLAKSLAEQLFHDERNLVRIDMSEYMEQHSISRLIGAPPGYEGHDDGGQLTDKVLRKPYSVVLFDEVEKAHKQILNILLQVLDDGILTDAKGKTVHFTNTVIIMTSNLGSQHLGNNEESLKEKRKRVRAEVEKHFSAELLNRLGSIVIFNSLSIEQLRKVALLRIDDENACFADRGITLDVTDAAVNFILSRRGVQVYGARQIETWIHNNVRSKVGDMMINGLIKESCIVHINTEPRKNGRMKLAYSIVERSGRPIPSVAAPSQQNEMARLSSWLNEKAPGQTNAVHGIMEALRRSRACSASKQHFIGSFLFLGLTSECKTEIGKVLANQLFGDEGRFIRINMSKYMEESSHPIETSHAVVLFDEDEKADVNVLKTLLGRLVVDGQGRTVNIEFRNTMVLFTCNLAMQEVSEQFRPKLLSLLDEIVTFDPSFHDNLKEVARRMMKDEEVRLAEKVISITVTQDALDVILSRSYDPVYGELSIRRWIQRIVTTKLSKMLVKEETDAKCTVIIKVKNEDELAYEVKTSGGPVNTETGEKSDILMNEDVRNEGDSTEEDYYSTDEEDYTNTSGIAAV